MKLHILAVGNKMPDWIESGFDEYRKRMPHEAKIELREIKPEKRSSATSRERIMANEAARIEAQLPQSRTLVVLDERGRLESTAGLAQLLKTWMQSGKDVVFVIGGADGTDPGLRASADMLLSLSPLTLPHGLVRVMLAEQLYRAVSLLNNHPYHREG